MLSATCASANHSTSAGLNSAFINIASNEQKMATSLRDEFEYYLAHQESFVAKYNGKFVALKDHEVIGVYDDELSAATDAGKKFKLGTFLVQKVEAGDSTYSQTFHSRVVFA